MNAKVNVWVAWKDFSKRIKLKQSFLLACFLVISGYFINNLPLFVGENSVAIHLAQIISQKIKGEDVATDNVIYIDVGYDLQLVDYSDRDHGVINGNIAITDRGKLCCLLDMLERSKYKYIILDVLFEPDVKTPSDSALYEKISSMDKIVVAQAPGVPVVDKLKDKAYLVDYMVTSLSDGFSKEEFLRPHGFCWGGIPTKDKVSLPLNNIFPIS